MRRSIFITLIIFILSMAGLEAQIPRMINYQGALMGSDKVPVEDGNYKIKFTIYDASDNTLWIEVHSQVFISGGIFNVLLGSVTPLDIVFDKPYSLGIKIGNDAELAPRMLLTSSAYSLNSERINGYEVSSTPKANKILPLDSSGKIPRAILPEGTSTGNFLSKNIADTTRGSANNEMLRIENTGTGRGMTVISAASHGIYGKSNGSSAGIEGEGGGTGPGVRGSSNTNHGVIGYSTANDKAGIYGNNTAGTGVWGNSQNGHGVYGQSNNGRGVKGVSDAGGVYGESTQGVAVEGRSNANDGVLGWTNSPSKSGVYGTSPFGNGVTGRSDGQDGILGVTTSSDTGHAGVHTRNEGGGPAVYSEGDIYATGKVYGNVGPFNGGPFPRPAYNSGWVSVQYDDGGFWRGDLNVNDYLPTTTYNNDNFFIEVMTKTYGTVGNEYMDQVYYQINTNNSLSVFVYDPNKWGFITHIRVRLWYIK